MFSKAEIWKFWAAWYVWTGVGTGIGPTDLSAEEAASAAEHSSCRTRGPESVLRGPQQKRRQHSVHLSIYQFIHSSIHPSISLSVYPLTHPPIHPLSICLLYWIKVLSTADCILGKAATNTEKNKISNLILLPFIKLFMEKISEKLF